MPKKKTDTPDANSALKEMERMMKNMARNAASDAQELVYDAWETPDPEEAFKLFEQALELDRNNVDAWLGLMSSISLSQEERISVLQKFVAMGEKNLGKKAFKTDKGHFWGLLETRPYMRARGSLAQELMEAGRLEESVAEHEGMLDLNPGDNQGMRYGLMALYLALYRLDDARKLFEQYDERHYSAMFGWASVLERFLSDDLSAAEKALQEVCERNPHAKAYFLGNKKLPKQMPGSYSMGSAEEAIIAYDILKVAWKKHPKAKRWLKAQCGK
jgi:tetratricopeptide (TPR) repeat protein